MTIQRDELPAQGEEALTRFTLVRTANASA
jgi:hypothetical protein